MNIYRLGRTRTYVNQILFPSIPKSAIKSSVTDNPNIVSKHLKSAIKSSVTNNDSKHEDPVFVDSPNLSIHRIINSHKINQPIENLFSQLAEDDVDAMKQVYTKLSEKGIQLPSSSYQILIKSLIKKGVSNDLVLATQICCKCIPQPWFSDFFKSAPLTINTLLKGIYTSDFDEFQDLVEMLENQGLRPDIYFYKSMIYQLCYEERFEEAMEVFETQSAKGIKFDSDTYNDLFSVLVCDKEGKNLDYIKWLYNDAHEKNVEFYHNCYETLIKVLSENGDFEAVLYIYDEYKRNKIPKYTLSDLCSNNIGGLCKEDKVDEAKAVFQWMVSKGMFPREFALMSLISRFCEDRYVEEVKWTFHKIQEKGLCTDDYCGTDVLKLISRVGDPETSRVAVQFLKRDEYYHPIAVKQKRKILNLFLGVPEVNKEMQSVYTTLPSWCI